MKSEVEKQAEWESIAAAIADKPAKGWARVSCPLCSDGHSDRKKSMGFNFATGGYHCFRCETTGKLPARFLGDEDLIEVEVVDEPKKAVEPAYGFTPIFDRLHCEEPFWEPYRAYLIGRGLRYEVLQEAGVGACSDGRLARRIVVPIQDYDDPSRGWRGWVARYAFGKHDRPYLYPSGMDRTGLLYNKPVLDQKTDTPVYVVEGTLDALSLWPDAVAVLGKPIDSQIDLLVRARRPVVVCLDGDAWQDGWMLALTLRHLGQRAGSIRLPPGVDPDEVDRALLDRVAAESLQAETGCSSLRL